MCGGLFSFCFLHETVFGNGQVAITHNYQIHAIELNQLKMKPTDYRQLTIDWLNKKCEEGYISDDDLVEIFQQVLEYNGIVSRKVAQEIIGLSQEGIRKHRKQYKFFNFNLCQMKPQ